ncbi:NADH dehydrogenase (ubiquinone) 1 beta subcomplex 8 [Clonorchis sinensis]|uniref:NADH dehydrogenase (Ubiquinone) 1 beta subcomplex 8 n=1 Tax=Clonorchis sinensis TaxID=79923 RepID=G7Y3M4_CLOSI|nr:NADH dehydrogenase (ubiquinone) 1 beta subcomplex 8 [Clonorchis sinensis]
MLRCLLSGPPLSRVLSGTCSRKLAYWNIEWKPAPYPCTSAQREAAAKRYGLLLTDYQPFEDDGYAPGDYPNMRNYNEANRDPWEHYDYYPVKRNYNEPVPFYWEFYSEAGADPDFQEVHHYGQPIWWICSPYGTLHVFSAGESKTIPILQKARTLHLRTRNVNSLSLPI